MRDSFWIEMLVIGFLLGVIANGLYSKHILKTSSEYKEGMRYGIEIGKQRQGALCHGQHSK